MGQASHRGAQMGHSELGTCGPDGSQSPPNIEVLTLVSQSRSPLVGFRHVAGSGPLSVSRSDGC